LIQVDDKLLALSDCLKK